MDIALRYQEQICEPAPELAAGSVCETPVAIVGAGPIGLSAAIDLALHGIRSVLVDEDVSVSVGSRAICWSKRTLEIFDRLGVGEPMVAKGVTWQLGRTFWGKDEIYNFDLLPEQGHKNPAFINLQQYHVENCLIERCCEFPELIDLRFGSRVIGLKQTKDNVRLDVGTTHGDYVIAADYVLACDGARSPIRHWLGLEFKGIHFEENFLIADVKMEAPFPQERWFWFQPDFHSGQSALLHKQPDNIYRIDFQLPPDADHEFETREKNVRARLDKLLQGREYEIDWVSIYQFHCRRIERFLHDRVIFLGDSAHIVSPFGARGGNGGIQDVDNLCWKLAYVLQGRAEKKLLESYDEERVFGADENIKNSARTTKFMSPDDGIERLFRDSALALARDLPFARKLVNPGRLSVPCALTGIGLQTNSPQSDDLLPAGIVCPDAPLQDNDGKNCWLLDWLGGGFTLLGVGVTLTDDIVQAADEYDIAVMPIAESDDAQGFVAERYGQGFYLIRPDQHIMAAWAAAAPPTAAQLAAMMTTVWSKDRR